MITNDTPAERIASVQDETIDLPNSPHAIVPILAGATLASSPQSGTLAALAASFTLAACSGGGSEEAVSSAASPISTAPLPLPNPISLTPVPSAAPVAVAPPGSAAPAAAPSVSTPVAAPPATGTPVAPVPAPAPVTTSAPGTPAPSPGAAPAPTPAPVTSPVPAPPAPGPVAPPTPLQPPPPAPLASVSQEQAARFLLQAQFSVSDTEIANVRGFDYAPWLAQQMNTPQSQTAWDWMESRGYGVSDINRYFFTTYPAEFAIWKQLMSAPDAARKRVALALSEIFVISFNSFEFSWRAHAMANYWDMLNKNAFGNFRQLLEEVTLHPGMGHYLNTKGNQKENTATGRVPDENYAREVMQLFTIGLHELDNFGIEKRYTSGPNAGNRIESYDSDDVSNLARVFTGWDFDTSDGVRVSVYKDGGGFESYTVESRDFARKPMRLDATRHSTLAATFLGTTIPANTPGAAALKTALDTLFNHPNVGPFIGKQLIQRLVTSNPSPAYVGRVTTAFNNNGSGVRGDMKAVVAAVLLDDEARNAAGLSSNTFGKLREPMLRLVQWSRTFGAQSAAGSWKLFDLSNPANQLGQTPFRAPSVFNFFRPGYVPPGTALATTQSPAPEFQLVNETSVGGYLNFMQGVIERGLNCPEPSVPEAAFRNYVYDIKATYANELPLLTAAATSTIATADATALIRRINLMLCAGQLSAATQSLLVSALTTPPLTAASTVQQRQERVWGAVLMTMACAEYLIQK